MPVGAVSRSGIFGSAQTRIIAIDCFPTQEECPGNGTISMPHLPPVRSGRWVQAGAISDDAWDGSRQTPLKGKVQAKTATTNCKEIW